MELVSTKLQKRWAANVGTEVEGILGEIAGMPHANARERFRRLGLVSQRYFIEAAEIVLVSETCRAIYPELDAAIPQEAAIRLARILDLWVDTLYEWLPVQKSAKWALDQLVVHIERFQGKGGAFLPLLIIKASIMADSIEAKQMVHDWVQDDRYAEAVASVTLPHDNEPIKYVQWVWWWTMHVIAGSEEAGQGRIGALVLLMYQSFPEDKAESFLSELESGLGEWAKPIYAKEAKVARGHWDKIKPGGELDQQLKKSN